MEDHLPQAPSFPTGTGYFEESFLPSDHTSTSTSHCPARNLQNHPRGLWLVPSFWIAPPISYHPTCRCQIALSSSNLGCNHLRHLGPHHHPGRVRHRSCLWPTLHILWPHPHTSFCWMKYRLCWPRGLKEVDILLRVLLKVLKKDERKHPIMDLRGLNHHDIRD